MDSLRTILSDKDFDEPVEVIAIKQYMRDNFQAEVQVTLREADIVITVPNAALASMLRFRSQDLRRRCRLKEQRLVIRIG